MGDRPPIHTPNSTQHSARRPASRLRDTSLNTAVLIQLRWESVTVCKEILTCHRPNPKRNSLFGLVGFTAQEVGALSKV